MGRADGFARPAARSSCHGRSPARYPSNKLKFNHLAMTSEGRPRELGQCSEIALKLLWTGGGGGIKFHNELRRSIKRSLKIVLY